jgi:hypothetical protein
MASPALALERQECFVNQTLANHALKFLAWLFRYGVIEYYGAFREAPIEPGAAVGDRCGSMETVATEG